MGKTGLVLWGWLWLVLSAGEALAGPRGSSVVVRFRVELPKHFSLYQNVYLSGNHASLGNWGPKGLPLARAGRFFSAAASIPANFPLAFKVTLGDWLHGEVYANGKERPNRLVQCASNCNSSVTVENFRLRVFHPVPSPTTSHIEYLHDVFAPAFGNYRSVAIYLPPQYDGTRRFPVLYALDGNLLFDVVANPNHVKWSLNDTLDRLFSGGWVSPFIVVGIYNTLRRSDEYLSCHESVSGQGGFAGLYAAFIRDVIKPYIDTRYRTLPDRKNTALMGSSFGGNFALFSAHSFGSLFSRFAALSPALWWDHYCLNDLLQKPLPVTPEKLWIDIGDREGWDDGAVNFKNGVAEVGQAYDALVAGGLVPGQNLMKWIEKGGIHHERSWGARVHHVLQFLFSP